MKFKVEELGDPKEGILVCQRTRKGEKPPASALVGTCNRCNHDIYVHPSSPDCVRVVCNECLMAEIEGRAEQEGVYLTPKQLEAVQEAIQNGPQDSQYTSFDNDILNLAMEKKLGVGPVVCGCGSALAQAISSTAPQAPNPDEYVANAVHSTIACLLSALHLGLDQQLLQRHMDELAELKAKRDHAKASEGRPPNAKVH